MKKSIVIALLMVLALSVSGFAAEIKTTGKVWTSWASDAGYKNSWRLELNGNLDPSAGFQIRYEGAGGLMKRANYWTNTPVGKVRVGLQWLDITALDVDGTGDYDALAESFTGISVSPNLGEGIAATAFIAPNNDGQTGHKVGAQASYDLKVAKVYGGFHKIGEEDAVYAIGASAPVGETLSVYGQANKFGDADMFYQVGGEAKVAGFDMYLEYRLKEDDKQIGFDVLKTIGNVEFNYTLTKVEDDDAVHFIGTTLYF